MLDRCQDKLECMLTVHRCTAEGTAASGTAFCVLHLRRSGLAPQSAPPQGPEAGEWRPVDAPPYGSLCLFPLRLWGSVLKQSEPPPDVLLAKEEMGNARNAGVGTGKVDLASEFSKVLRRFVQVGFALTLLIVFGYYALSVTGSVLAQVSRPQFPPLRIGRQQDSRPSFMHQALGLPTRGPRDASYFADCNGMYSDLCPAMSRLDERSGYCC